jgi:polygalacturonase
MYRCRSLLWGENLSGIGLTGAGVFDGQGDAWRPVKKVKVSAEMWAELVAQGGLVEQKAGIWWPSRKAFRGHRLWLQILDHGVEVAPEVLASVRHGLPPTLVKLSGCRNIRINGPTFINSPSWGIHLFACRDVEVRHITVSSPHYAQNGDGIDIDSTSAVVVSDSTFDVGDDAICLKSGRDPGGPQRPLPTENIAIARCRVLRGHGGVTLGSETSGGIRNVRVAQCVFDGTDVGIRIKTARGRGGVIEDVVFRDIEMPAIRRAAIQFDMGYGLKGALKPAKADAGTPRVRNIKIHNVSCGNASVGIDMRGLPEQPIEAIELRNLDLTADKGAAIRDVSGLSLTNVRLRSSATPAATFERVSGLTTKNVDMLPRV